MRVLKKMKEYWKKKENIRDEVKKKKARLLKKMKEYWKEREDGRWLKMSRLLWRKWRYWKKMWNTEENESTENKDKRWGRGNNCVCTENI